MTIELFSFVLQKHNDLILERYLNYVVFISYLVDC